VQLPQIRTLHQEAGSRSRYACGIAQKITVAFMAGMLAVSTAGPAFADGHRHQHAVSAAKKKGNKSKTVTKTFSSEEEIAIPAAGSADARGESDPYPSTIDVAGFKKARITDVNLTLRGLSHTFVPDFKVLIVAPGGRNAFVMASVGNNSPVFAGANDLTLTLDDEAEEALPATDALTSGSFQPFSQNAGVNSFPVPAPPLSGDVALATFDGLNPNGQWRLFILDGGQSDVGALDGGWSLEITAKAKVKAKQKHKKRH
jgi:subtilisin-like proprotein convertase family protein